MSRQLLFLDIDGVMHSVDRVQATGASDKGLFEYLPSLGRILDQCPDLSVIISSNWRSTHSLQQLQGFFGAWGHRVIGTTANIDAHGSLTANRFQECLAVAEQLGVADWVIVDD